MKIEEAENEIIEAVAAMANERPSSTIALLTGMFVGLLEKQIEDQGGDPSLEIRINSQGRRDITIHTQVPNAIELTGRGSEAPEGPR